MAATNINYRDSVTVREAKGPKPRCGPGCTLDPSSPLPDSGGYQRSLAVLGLWLHCPNLCLCGHVASSLRVCVQMSFCCGDTSHWIQVQLTSGRSHPNFIIAAKTLFPNKFTFTGASGHDLLGGHSSTPYTTPPVSFPISLCLFHCVVTHTRAERLA